MTTKQVATKQVVLSILLLAAGGFGGRPLVDGFKVKKAKVDHLTVIDCDGCGSAPGGGPAVTPTQLDPATFSHGRIRSEGVPVIYVSDTFTRADVASITGTPAQVGGVNWQNTAFGAPATQMGVVSNALTCTDVHCSGFGKSPTAEYVDTGRSDETLSVDTQLVSGGGGTTVFFARINSGLTQALQVYNSAFSSQSHLCIEGYGGGAPAPVCSSGFALSSATVTVTLSMVGNVITAAVPSVGASVTMTTAYNNTATRAGIQYGAGGQIQTYTNFVASAPLQPVGLSLRGDYANGTDFATMILGENANAGAGGVEIRTPTGDAVTVNGVDLASLGYGAVTCDSSYTISFGTVTGPTDAEITKVCTTATTNVCNVSSSTEVFGGFLQAVPTTTDHVLIRNYCLTGTCAFTAGASYHVICQS